MTSGTPSRSKSPLVEASLKEAASKAKVDPSSPGPSKKKKLKKANKSKKKPAKKTQETKMKIKAKTKTEPKKGPQPKPKPKPKRKDNVKKGQKRKEVTIIDQKEEEEERRLTALLFGEGTTDVGVEDDDQHDMEGEPSGKARFDDRDQDYGDTDTKSSSGALFELDRSGRTDDGNDGSNEKSTAVVEYDDDDDGRGDKETSQTPAWVDDDDLNVSVNAMATHRLRKLRTHRSEDATALNGAEFENRLRRRFETTTMASARTDWADVDKQTGHDLDDDDEEDFTDDKGYSSRDQSDLLLSSSAAPLLAASASRLPSQVLRVKRCPNANQEAPNEAAVKAVSFHPGSDPDQPLMLTAGLDKTLRFFSVGEEESRKVHGIHFRDLPIHNAAFLGDTGKVALSGRRSYFYFYDAIEGKVCSRTKTVFDRCTVLSVSCLGVSLLLELLCLVPYTFVHPFMAFKSDLYTKRSVLSSDLCRCHHHHPYAHDSWTELIGSWVDKSVVSKHS